MAWPQSQDYNEAIQSPPTNFADPELRSGEAVTNALGLPMPRSGNFADVYEIRCPDGSRWAVKCFTPRGARPARTLSRDQPLFAAGQAAVHRRVQYLEQGIRVRGEWFPILKMQWVEGLHAQRIRSQHLDKPAMLEALLQIWGRMATWLREANVAHADLAAWQCLAGARRRPIRWL